MRFSKICQNKCQVSNENIDSNSKIAHNKKDASVVTTQVSFSNDTKIFCRVFFSKSTMNI